MWNKQKYFRKGNYLWMDGGTLHVSLILPFRTAAMLSFILLFSSHSCESFHWLNRGQLCYQYHDSSDEDARLIWWRYTTHLMKMHYSSDEDARLIWWRCTTHLMKMHDPSDEDTRLIWWSCTTHLMKIHDSSDEDATIHPQIISFSKVFLFISHGPSYLICWTLPNKKVDIFDFERVWWRWVVHLHCSSSKW
jgi:hypothetical protein